MKPYCERDGIVIYHGDCRDWVAQVPECFRADALLTDPPFGIGFGEYESHKDSAECYTEILDRIWRFESRVEDGWAAVFQPSPKVREWGTRIPRDFRLWAFCKDFGQVFASVGPAWRTDYCLFWPVGDPQTPTHGTTKGRDWSAGTTANTKNRFPHPCSRPLWQMVDLVSALTVPHAVILDPFMGSGTTLVAAKQLGRHAIGIEIEERYCEIAAKRISQATLFQPEPEPPKQAKMSLTAPGETE